MSRASNSARPIVCASGALLALTLVAVACGGGGGGSSFTPPPPPPALSITTSSLPTGTVGQAYSVTMQASGGTGTRTWSASGLPAGLAIAASTGVISGTPSSAGTSSVTVTVQDSANPPQTNTRQYSLVIDPPPALTITTSSLPAGIVGQPYGTTVQASGGTPPFTWSATGLPAGLSIAAGTGTISGTPSASGTFTVDVQVQDSGSPPQTAPRQFSLTIQPAPSPSGRNDSVSTATPLTTGGNLTITASISPFSDPSTTGPDQDFYLLTANAGATVTVEIFARRTNPDTGINLNSLLDSVILIVDSNGQPFSTCRDPGDDNPPAGLPLTPDSTPNAFDDLCINDDIVIGSNRDSRLEFQVPSNGTTFFVRVLDWRGDARPDLRYTLKITGAN